MWSEPVLKYRPADFLVRENLVVDLCAPQEGRYQYALLRKQGYTTTEAVDSIARRFSLEASSVGYGGRKDEDAVTEQLVSMPRHAEYTGNGQRWRDQGREGWLELQPYGYGHEPLRVGQVEGNGFRVVVRNLHPAAAGRLWKRRRFTHFFLNYYDIQRFGVPGGVKRTHMVGKAMLTDRWQDALDVLRSLGAPESRAAQAWTGAPEGYFEALDSRVRAFYLAAHSADRWNRELADTVMAACAMNERFDIEIEDVRFCYAASPEETIRVLAQRSNIPYTRYRFDGCALVSQRVDRSSAIQTAVSVEEPERDPHFSGAAAVALRFFLPSGSYGTAAIRQLLHHVRLGGEEGS